MFLTHDSQLLHIMTAGNPDAPAVVLLHSLGTSGQLWQDQLAELSRSHFVICPDFRGHGLSEESRQPLTCELLAEDVLAILAMMDIGRFALAGISLGGVVAQIVAARAGGRVRGLALFDSYVASLNPQMWQDRAAQVRREGLGAAAAGVAGLWMTPAQAATPAGRGMAQMLARTSAEGYAAACDALRLADNRAIAAQITCPTVVAVGSEDRAAPVAAAEALAAAMVAASGGAQLHIIEGAAHLPLMHHAARCLDILGRIL